MAVARVVKISLYLQQVLAGWSVSAHFPSRSLSSVAYRGTCPMSLCMSLARNRAQSVGFEASSLSPPWAVPAAASTSAPGPLQTLLIRYSTVSPRSSMMNRPEPTNSACSNDLYRIDPVSKVTCITMTRCQRHGSRYNESYRRSAAGGQKHRVEEGRHAANLQELPNSVVLAFADRPRILRIAFVISTSPV